MKHISKLDRVFIETGLAVAWEVEGEARGRAEGERKAFGIAQNLVKLGLPIETVISATQLDPEKVKALYQVSNNNYQVTKLSKNCIGAAQEIRINHGRHGVSRSFDPKIILCYLIIRTG